jgi:hypothetical protein
MVSLAEPSQRNVEDLVALRSQQWCEIAPDAGAAPGAVHEHEDCHRQPLYDALFVNGTLPSLM